MAGRVSQKRDERRRENAANTALPVASAVGAVYRAAICEKKKEREREREKKIRVDYGYYAVRARGARKNVFRGNQRRSEPAPVNEPQRFFLTDIVTVKSKSTPAVAQTTTGRRHP